MKESIKEGSDDLHYLWNHVKRHPLAYTFGSLLLYLLAQSYQNPADFDCTAGLTMSGRYYDGDHILVVNHRLAEKLLDENTGDYIDNGPTIGQEMSIRTDGTHISAFFDQGGIATFSYLPPIEGDMFGSGTSVTLRGRSDAISRNSDNTVTTKTITAVTRGYNLFSSRTEIGLLTLICDQENQIVALMPPENLKPK